ncbi:MAG: multicopper oxidase domain-containing protein, partial [Gammaproteobacteria bacterium]|nr:multicopper oxidase domain-containing protein [Gammaproteobacteria bacterium]
PGVSFPGIARGETFTYEYELKQSGTYWYHSHSGLQEQLGHYGPLIVDPAEPEPFEHDRDYVVVLSDWTFEDPDRVFRKLKVAEGYYNYQKRTVFDFFRDVSAKGWNATLKERAMWGRMR